MRPCSIIGQGTFVAGMVCFVFFPVRSHLIALRYTWRCHGIGARRREFLNESTLHDPDFVAWVISIGL